MTIPVPQRLAAAGRRLGMALESRYRWISVRSFRAYGARPSAQTTAGGVSDSTCEDVTVTFPEPACALGFTEQQLETILASGLTEYRRWTAGKTRALCAGAPSCDAVHGVIHYEDDVRRFWRQNMHAGGFEPPNAG